MRVAVEFAKFEPWAAKEVPPERVATAPPPRVMLLVTVSALVALAVPVAKFALATRAPLPTVTVPELPVVSVPLSVPFKASVPALTVVAPE